MSDPMTEAFYEELEKEVHNPSHYKKGPIETIDYIKSVLGTTGFIDYCNGNVLKYVSRWENKHGLVDLHKAKTYLDWAITAAEEEKRGEI